MKQKSRRHKGGSHQQGVGSEPLEAHLAAHLCATQWLTEGWPLQGGWPKEALWRAADAIFLGLALVSCPTATYIVTPRLVERTKLTSLDLI